MTPCVVGACACEVYAAPVPHCLRRRRRRRDAKQKSIHVASGRPDVARHIYEY